MNATYSLECNNPFATMTQHRILIPMQFTVSPWAYKDKKWVSLKISTDPI